MSVTVNRTAQRYSSGSQATPRMVLLHTTEGMGWPSYGGGSSAPHATIRPIPGEGIEVREHIPFGQFAKALQNRPGGVQTNTSGVLQFELMGTCDERAASRAYYWPKADDAVLRALADYLRPIMATYGIPHTSDVTWKSYNRGQAPSSYGLSNGVRMSFEKWMTFRGICGHQHAPENDHGDPGDFPIATLLRHLSRASAATPVEAPATSDLRKEWLTKQIAEHGKLSVGTVKRLQAEVGVTIDGQLGPETKKAVQRWLGVTADGVWGPKTYAAMRRKVGATNPTGGWTEDLGKALQRHLNALAKERRS